MAMDLGWAILRLDYVSYLGLLTDYFALGVLDCASIDEGFLPILVLGYLLLSAHYVSIFILYHLHLLLYLLLSLLYLLIRINSLYSLLLLPNLNRIFPILDLRNLGLRLDNITIRILHNIPFYNLGPPLFLNHILLMLEHRPIIPTLNLNRIFLLPQHYAIRVHYFISLDHCYMILLFDY